MATRTPLEGRALTLGPTAPTTRRALGLIAWCVLEDLAETAEVRTGGTVSCETVRGTAGTLGLANDTVARALRRLADAELVAYVPRCGGDGRFASSHYRLAFPADIFLGLPVSIAAAPANRSRSSSTRHRPADATQLSLIDSVPDAS